MNVVSNSGIVHKVIKGKALCMSTMYIKELKEVKRKVTCKKCNYKLSKITDTEIIDLLQSIINKNGVLELTINSQNLRKSLITLLASELS